MRQTNVKADSTLGIRSVSASQGCIAMKVPGQKQPSNRDIAISSVNDQLIPTSRIPARYPLHGLVFQVPLFSPDIFFRAF